jgi:hypothetical protein
MRSSPEKLSQPGSCRLSSSVGNELCCAHNGTQPSKKIAIQRKT